MRERLVEKGYSVIVKNNNIDGALRKLKNKLKEANLYVEVQKHKFYVKPSTLRREARNRGKRRQEFDRKKEELAQNKRIF